MQLYILIAAFGLIVGSFLNVCIYRLPQEGMSIVFPPSACPSCGKALRPWHNIPVISYIALGGRCAYCKSRISLRYPTVEALNACLYVLIYMKFGLSAYSIYYMMFLSALIVITFIDIAHQIIPDVISLPGIVLGLIGSIFILPEPHVYGRLLGIVGSLTGLLTGGLIFYVIAVASRGGMGGGDIKFMAMTGATLGWKSVLLTIFIGSFAGSMYGLSLMVFKGKGRKTKIPFGPFLALGAAVSLFYGREIVVFYLK
ncbi:MAG: prepilin peptidase [Candidatus Magnetominusculus sp. LBB02]|nr:prepilin peptidase [Candidatus Magnetominusculus sp. LBB02]